MAAKTAGYTFGSLVGKILDVAHERYFGVPAPRDIPATTVNTVEFWTSDGHRARCPQRLITPKTLHEKKLIHNAYENLF